MSEVRSSGELEDARLGDLASQAVAAVLLSGREHHAVRRSGAGWHVALVAWREGAPCPLEPPPRLAQIPLHLSTCEADVLWVVRQAAPERLTGPRVQRALIEAGLLHGESTIRAALARLVAEGLLTNARDRRGYGAADVIQHATGGAAAIAGA